MRRILAMLSPRRRTTSGICPQSREEERHLEFLRARREAKRAMRREKSP